MKPTQFRIDGDKTRGYVAADLQDPWKRYLPSPQKAVQAVHGTQSSTDNTTEDCEKLVPVLDVPLVPLNPGMGGGVPDGSGTDDYEERAAALEYDAGLTREEAEQQAADEMEFPEMPPCLRRNGGGG